MRMDVIQSKCVNVKAFKSFIHELRSTIGNGVPSEYIAELSMLGDLFCSKLFIINNIVKATRSTQTPRESDTWSSEECTLAYLVNFRNIHVNLYENNSYKVYEHLIAFNDRFLDQYIHILYKLVGEDTTPIDLVSAMQYKSVLVLFLSSFYYSRRFCYEMKDDSRTTVILISTLLVRHLPLIIEFDQWYKNKLTKSNLMPVSKCILIALSPKEDTLSIDEYILEIKTAEYKLKSELLKTADEIVQFGIRNNYDITTCESELCELGLSAYLRPPYTR